MYTSKHKRNLAITGGVAASIIVAPVVAGLTVGKTRCTVNTEGHPPDVVDCINVNTYMAALHFSIFVESIFNIYDFLIPLTAN